MGKPSDKISSLNDVYAALKEKGSINHDNINEISKLLDSDAHSIKYNGGIVDYTGKDGLDRNEPLGEPQSKEWFEQRSRSSAALWLKESVYKEYAVFGSTPDIDEVLSDFKVYNVLAIKGSDNLIIKVCLPLDTHIMAIVVKRDMRCKDKLIDYLESDEAALQPFTLVEDNMRAGFGLQNWVQKIKDLRAKLIGRNESLIRGLEHVVETKYNNQFVMVKLPGSSKQIKIKIKDYFNQFDAKMVSNISQMKTLDFSRMKVVKSLSLDQNLEKNSNKNNTNNYSTLVDKEFQKSFLKKYKADITSVFEHKFASEQEYRFKEVGNQMNMKSVKEHIERLNQSINAEIKNSNDIILLQNDPRFKNDFSNILKKKDLLLKINKYKALLKTLEKDTIEPSIKKLYSKISDKIDLLAGFTNGGDSLLNEYEYKKREEINTLRVNKAKLEKDLNSLKNTMAIKDSKIYKLNKLYNQIRSYKEQLSDSMKI